jgi:uncharacterized protein YukE
MTKAEIDARAQRQQETIKKVAQRLRAKAAEIAKRFEGRSFTAAEVYPEVDQAWKSASEMHKVAHTLHNISKEHLKQADYIVIRLLELRAFFKRELKSPMRHAPGSEMWRKARDYQMAPILWLVEVQRPILQRQIAHDKAVATVANVPSATVTYVRNQASQALGLPTWFVPALAGTFLVAVGIRVFQVVSPALPRRG